MSPILTVTSGLLCHWDFSGPDPMASKGTIQCRLICEGSPVQVFAPGPVGGNAFVLPGIKLMIPFEHSDHIGKALRNDRLTVVGWMRAGTEKVWYPGNKEKKEAWTFFALYLDHTSQTPVFSSQYPQVLSGTPISFSIAARSGEKTEGIYLEVERKSTVCTGCFSLLSGMTLFARRLSFHEIQLLYHHL